ncbi:hypothetical protein LEN26_019978 [Aphanomyces euteiches]|nr:hypothetical protein LEN26_019978 [Aphanomyces euteiches]
MNGQGGGMNGMMANVGGGNMMGANGGGLNPSGNTMMGQEAANATTTAAPNVTSTLVPITTPKPATVVPATTAVARSSSSSIGLGATALVSALLYVVAAL